jgi:redox-sensitive bicupin YhaK (pirin superfamily)
MSAGSGVVRTEFNTARERCQLLQIWILPSRQGIVPSYDPKKLDVAAITNKFARIAGPDPQPNEVRLAQDAEIWATRLDADIEVIHQLAPGRRAWIQVAKGEVSLGEENLKAGDAAAVTDQDKIALRSRAPSEVLLFDLA